jgi:hypothetical protein
VAVGGRFNERYYLPPPPLYTDVVSESESMF